MASVQPLHTVRMMTTQVLSATVSNARACRRVESKRTGVAISVKADVADPRQVQALLDQTVKAFGKIDMALMCAS